MFKTVARHMITYLPSKLLPALTGLVTVPILTRLFLPAEYGYYVLALGISDFLFAMACSGFGSGAIRFYPVYKAKSELSVFFTTLSASIAVIVAASSVASWLALSMLRGHLRVDLYPLLFIGVMIFAVRAAFTVFMQIARVQERSGLYTLFELLVRYGSLGFGLSLVIVCGLRVEGLLWGEFLVLVAVLPFLIALTIRGSVLSTRHFRLREALQMWHYAWPLALGNMAMWGLRLSDRYIIGFLRSDSEVGLYSVGYNISSKSIDMLVALFLLTMEPMVMNAWETQGREATERILAVITRLFLVLCVPAAAGLSILASPLVSLLTTEAYLKGHLVVGFIAFSSVAWGLAQLATRGMLIGKDTRRLAINQIAAAFVNLALNLALIPRFGFLAAGINTLVAYLGMLGLQVYASRAYLTWRFPLKTLRNVSIATAVMGLVTHRVYALPTEWRTHVHPGYLFLSIVVAIPVYFASLWLLGEANRGERAAVRQWWYKVARMAGPSFLRRPQ